jgi:hypothetical protein
VQRVEKALDARLDALVVLETLKRQEGIITASYQMLLAKERAGNMTNSDVRRMNRVRSEVDQVGQAKAAGVRTLNLLKRRNERDISWYRKGRAEQFCSMVAEFSAAQEALQESQAELWLGMAARTGAHTVDAGEDLSGINLSELGLKVSHSAVLVDPADEDSDSAHPPDGPLPAEHAAIA